VVQDASHALEESRSLEAVQLLVEELEPHELEDSQIRGQRTESARNRTEERVRHVGQFHEDGETERSGESEAEEYPGDEECNVPSAVGE